MNRRDLITAGAMLPALAALPAKASTIGPIERCYLEYRRRNDLVNTTDCGFDGPSDYVIDWIDVPVNEGMAMRPDTVADFAAYLLLVVGI